MLLPPILPVIREKFGLSLMMGAVLLFVHSFTHNGIQVFVGHFRANKGTPLFLLIGLVLAGGVCFVAFLSQIGFGFVLLIILMFVSGSGIGMIHPEGLRGVHNLGKIGSSISTSVFMSLGFLGCAFGGWVSAYLVASFGLKGLYGLFLLPVVVILLVVFLRIRLAVGGGIEGDNSGYKMSFRLPFWWIFIIAMPAAISTLVIVWFLPTRLNELGFELTFGGFSMLVFSLSCAAGSIFWGAVGHRKELIICATLALFLGVPVSIGYLLLIEYKAAVMLLFGIGFFGIGAYVLMVTMARHAIGLNLGQRMGFMVGGSWALAGVIVLPALKLLGLDALLRFVPVGYLLSGVAGLLVVRERFKKSET